MFFFPFLLPGHCYSVIYRVVSIVSNGCNQSMFVFLYVVLSRCIDVSTLSSVLASPLPYFFLDTYSLSSSSLGCKVLCIVISFLFLTSICLCSSLVHFRKVPEYLPRSPAQVFIPLIRFLLESFVSSSFLVLLRYSFWVLSFIWTCLMVSASKILKYL